MNTWTDAFSLPTPTVRDEVFDTIVSAYASGITSLLLERQISEIERSSAGLVDYIRCAVRAPMNAATGWDYAFGRAHLSLKEAKVPPIDAAVRIGLCMVCAAQPGRWSARLPATTLQFGNMAVEAVTAVEAEASDDGVCSLRFDRAEAAPIECVRAGPSKPWTGSGSRSLESVGVARPVWLLTRSAVPIAQVGGEVFDACNPVADLTQEMIRSLRGGFAALQRNDPLYVPWVERVLKGLVVCPLQMEYRQVSGSWEDVPGFVHISSPHPAIDIAEILVHECAHQYFYMLQRVGPMDDASDSTLYWSPPIRKHRPLSRILMAYHALANVIILYDAVRRQASPDREDSLYVQANWPDLVNAVRTLDTPLRGNAALTSFGRGLYEPLAARLELIEDAVCHAEA